jgi:hypothetical protein
MKTRIRNFIIIVSLLALAAASYAVIAVMRPKPEVAVAEATPPPIIMRERDDMDWDRRFPDAVRITIESQSYETITLTADPFGYWTGVERSRLRLEQEIIVMMLTAFTELTLAEVFIEDAEGGDLEQYGLAPPELTFSVSYRDGAVLTVYVGNQTVDRRFYYVMVSGDPNVYLASNARLWLFVGGYDMFVDRWLPRVPVADIVALTAKRRDQPPIIMEMVDEHDLSHMDDFFMQYGLGMTAPMTDVLVSLDGLDYEIIRFLNNMTDPNQGGLFGELVDIAPTDLSQYGFDDPRLDLYIEFEDGSVYHLIIGDNADEFGGTSYATFSGLDGVWIARNMFLFQLLEMDPFHMVFNFLVFFDFTEGNMPRLELNLASGYFEALIDHSTLPPGDGFANERHHIEVTVNGQEVQDRAFRRYMTELFTLEREYVVEPHAPPGEPAEWIKFHFDDGRVLLLEFYVHTAAFYGISINGMDIQFLIRRHMLNELNNSMEALLDGRMDRR